MNPASHRHDSTHAALEERMPVLRRLKQVVLRALIAAGLALAFAIAPLPWSTPRWFIQFQVPMVVFLFIAYMAVLLYDTFFYERYRS